MYERGMVAVWAADSTQHHTNELHHMCICMCVAFISAYHFQTNYKLFSTTPIRQMAISRAQYINTGGANQWVCTLRMYEMYYVCLLTRANVQTHWYDSVICSWTLLTSWISGNRPYQLARRDKHMPSTQSQQFSHCVCVRARAICMFGDCFNQSGSDWQFQHSNRMRIGARTVASGVCCYVKHTCGAYELTHFVQSSGAWVESIRLEEQKKNAHSTASYGLLIFRIFDRTRHVIGIFYSTYLYNWLMRLTLHRWNKNHELQYNVAIRAKNHLILKLQSSISSAYITIFATNCLLDKHNIACHWYSFDRWKLI